MNGLCLHLYRATGMTVVVVAQVVCELFVSSVVQGR